MKGFGTVVAGTLIAGRVRTDDEVEILPGRRGARVRGIQVHGDSVEEARAGQRTALNLQRIELDEVERGMVVTPPGVFAPSVAFDVHVELLALRAGADRPPEADPLSHRHRGGDGIRGPARTGRAPARPGRVRAGAAGAPDIRPARRPLHHPAILADADARRRRDPRRAAGTASPIRSHGAGTARDPARIAPERANRLPRSTAPALERWTWRSWSAGSASAGTRSSTRSTSSPARAAIRDIGDTPRVVVAAATLEDAAGALLNAVRQFHQSEPLAKGIGREDLKGRTLRNASPLLFRAALDHLVDARPDHARSGHRP